MSGIKAEWERPSPCQFSGRARSHMAQGLLLIPIRSRGGTALVGRSGPSAFVPISIAEATISQVAAVAICEPLVVRRTAMLIVHHSVGKIIRVAAIAAGMLPPMKGTEPTAPPAGTSL